MSKGDTLLLCYNRGCGKKFDPNDNNDDSCVHHPGQPVFHDAYKGWSCCNKKCIDFTEFLNIKGCTKSRHTNEKPPEPEKPIVDKSKSNEVVEVKPKPIKSESRLKRPPFDTPQVTLNPTVSPTLLEQIKGLTRTAIDKTGDSDIVIGQTCKNKPCKATYTGTAIDDEVCTYHPGEPIFHEGMKYWSCCQKKTTDFSVFLSQPGCTEGKHVWVEKNVHKKVDCRLDWHQTGTFVIVSVYAKKYQPDRSYVKLNPIRLTLSLYLLEENSTVERDLELAGIVNVDQSSVNMLPTKVEIKLRKMEPGSWSVLHFPRHNSTGSEDTTQKDEDISAQVEAVDLSDL